MKAILSPLRTDRKGKVNKKSNIDPIGNRTRHFQDFSVVPQATAPPLVSPPPPPKNNTN